MNSQKLVQHINSLSDISDIMSAMKYLSQMESNKLSRYIEHQKRAMTSIEFAVEDFINFNPELLKKVSFREKPKNHIVVILGSERGFCGNYNATLYQSLEKYLNNSSNNVEELTIITIGYKMRDKFDQHSRLHKNLSGPRLTEEIPDIISELIESIGTLYQVNKAEDKQLLQLTVLHHSEENSDILSQPIFRNILPAFQDLEPKHDAYRTPPQIHLSNSELFTSLLDEYLFASLNQIFYAAFMSENSHRVRHMENSLHKLSEKIKGLSVKRNEIRQEEITEELEVIMLSSSAIEGEIDNVQEI